MDVLYSYELKGSAKEFDLLLAAEECLHQVASIGITGCAVQFLILLPVFHCFIEGSRVGWWVGLELLFMLLVVWVGAVWLGHGDPLG